MDLTIEQLADLKISIEKYKNDLKEITAKHDHLIAENKNLDETNRRLEKEINIQVERKERHIAENETLLAEKQKIIEDFDSKSAVQYRELREKEEKVTSIDAQNKLRAQELEKREYNIMQKWVENDEKIKSLEARNREIKKEIALLEVSRTENLKTLKSVETVKNQTLLREREMRARIKELEAKQEETANKEKELQKEIVKNSDKLIEISAKEQTITQTEKNLKILNNLFSELKDAIAKSWITLWNVKAVINSKSANEIKEIKEAIDTEIQETPEEVTETPEEVVEDIVVDTPEEVVDTPELIKLEWMAYNDMMKLAKEWWVDLSWKAPKKEELINLLVNAWIWQI